METKNEMEKLTRNGEEIVETVDALGPILDIQPIKNETLELCRCGRRLMIGNYAGRKVCAGTGVVPSVCRATRVPDEYLGTMAMEIHEPCPNCCDVDHEDPEEC